MSLLIIEMNCGSFCNAHAPFLFQFASGCPEDIWRQLQYKRNGCHLGRGTAEISSRFSLNAKDLKY